MWKAFGIAKSNGGHRAWSEACLDTQGKEALPLLIQAHSFFIQAHLLLFQAHSLHFVIKIMPVVLSETMSPSASWAVLSETKARVLRDGGLGGCNVRQKAGILSNGLLMTDCFIHHFQLLLLWEQPRLDPFKQIGKVLNAAYGALKPQNLLTAAQTH